MLIRATVRRKGKLVVAATEYEITDRPNCSLPASGMVRLIAAIATISLVIAFAFCLAGAWMVLPFAGLELLALAYAFYLMHCHAEDYENITITGDRLAVEKRDVHHVSEAEFHRYWVRVVLRNSPEGEQRLWLRSHGREVEVGRYRTAAQRLALAQQLQERTGAFYQR